MRKWFLAVALAALASRASAGPVPPFGCPNCLLNTSSPQNGTFNLTQGATIQGLLTVSTESVTTLYVTNLTIANLAGNGSALTTLNASALASGTVPSSVIAGNYQGITGVGHISSGTWNGTLIGTQFGGNGQNWSAVGANNVPYFTGTGTLGVLPPATGALVYTGSALSYTQTPALAGTYFTAIPPTAIASGNLPNGVAVSSNSIAVVQGASVLGNISGGAAYLTAPMSISNLIATTLPTTIAASSITATGVAAQTCGGPSLLCALNIHTDGRVYSTAQYPFVVAPSSITPGALPLSVAVSPAQLVAGTDPYQFTSASSVTASAFFGDGSHLTGLSAATIPNTISSSFTVTNAGGFLAPLFTASGTPGFVGNGSGLTNVPQGSVAGLAAQLAAVAASTTTAAANVTTLFADVNSTGSALTVETARAEAAEGVLSASTQALATAQLGYLPLAGGTLTGSVTAQAPVVAQSSVTASAFFGDGSHLTGVTAALGNLTGPVTSVGLATTIIGPVPQAAVNLSTVAIALNNLNGMFVTNPSSMTNTSAGGLLVASSVTAGAFFGDGSHLSGIGAAPVWSSITGFPAPCGLPFVVGTVGASLGCVQPSNVTGNAATATALAASPTGCTLPQVAVGVGSNGNAVCAEPSNVTGNAATATVASSVAPGGVNLSTVTAALANYLPLAGGMMSGALTVSGSSVTASAFFGDGSHLTQLTPANISAGTAGISITGNAATVTTNANLTGPVTSVGNATSIPGPVPQAAVNLSTVPAAGACSLPNVVTALNAGSAPTCTEPSNVTGTAANVTGTVAVANGGTGATTAAGAVANIVNGQSISPLNLSVSSVTKLGGYFDPLAYGSVSTTTVDAYGDILMDSLAGNYLQWGVAGSTSSLDSYGNVNLGSGNISMGTGQVLLGYPYNTTLGVGGITLNTGSRGSTYINVQSAGGLPALTLGEQGGVAPTGDFMLASAVGIGISANDSSTGFDMEVDSTTGNVGFGRGVYGASHAGALNTVDVAGVLWAESFNVAASNNYGPSQTGSGPALSSLRSATLTGMAPYVQLAGVGQPLLLTAQSGASYNASVYIDSTTHNVGITNGSGAFKPATPPVAPLSLVGDMAVSSATASAPTVYISSAGTISASGAVYAVSGANVSTMTPTGIQTQNLYVGSTTANYTPAVLASNNGYPQLQLAEPSGAWSIISENNYTPGDLTFSWQTNERFRWNYNGEFCNGYSGSQCLRSFGDGVFSGSVGVGTPTPAATLSVNGNFSWGTGVNISTGNADGSLVTASSVTINTGNADGTGAKLVLSNWPGVAGWAQFNMAGVGAGGLAINTPVDFNGNFAGNNGSFSWYNDKATFGNNPVEISSGTLIVDGAGAVAAIGSAPAPGAVLTAAGMIQASSATFTAGVYTTTLNATSNATIATVNSKYYRDSTNVYNLASRATTEWQLGGGYQLMLTDGGAVAISSASPVGYAFSVGATTGSAVDVNGHNLSFGPAPVLSSCGTSPSIHGTDRIGAITLGTAATGCVMTFVAPYPTGSQVSCTATTNSTTIPAALTSASTSAVTFSLSAAITGGVIYYNCGAAL